MLTQEVTHVLDNPIWSSLTTLRAEFAEGGPLARRFLREIGPMAGMCRQSAEAYAELGALLAPGEIAVLALDEAPRLPPGWEIVLHKSGDQMVYEGAPVAEERVNDFHMVTLGAADVEEMVALTALTDPGPFRVGTIELGGYVGIRVDSRLAAMAGERHRVPGFTEVSAVCTHPDFRGRGYAQAVMKTVMRAIEARGETPMLHVFSSNLPAIRVYESLGYRLRRRFHFVAVQAERLEQ